MLEKTVKAAVKKRLETLGAYQHWPVQTGRGSRCLDCHGCFHGRYFAVETKAPGKVPTPIQNFTIGEIRKSGGLVFVVDSVEKANDLFNGCIKSDWADPRPLRPKTRRPDR